MEIYIKASATSLANLLGFELGGDSGMEDGEVSQEGGGSTWMLAASTLPLLLDTSKEVVISDPFRMMTSTKQPDQLDFTDRNICTGTQSEVQKKGQGKVKLRQKGLRRRKSKKRITSFSPSFSSPAKILPSSAPVKRKKMVSLLSSEEVS